MKTKTLPTKISTDRSSFHCQPTLQTEHQQGRAIVPALNVVPCLKLPNPREKGSRRAKGRCRVALVDWRYPNERPLRCSLQSKTSKCTAQRLSSSSTAVSGMTFWSRRTRSITKLASQGTYNMEIGVANQTRSAQINCALCTNFHVISGSLCTPQRTFNRIFRGIGRNLTTIYDGRISKYAPIYASAPKYQSI
jgi:hypothetical protein